MQGPFYQGMNAATLQMVNAAFLVTKESGKNGGFSEKVEAARETGAVCVVIRRPVHETGYSLDEICRLADEAVGRLVGAGCKMVVVACNTATAAAIDFLRRKYRQMPIVGWNPP